MLTPDLSVEDFDAEAWRLLGDLLVPLLRGRREPSDGEGPESPGGGLLALTSSGRLRKLVGTRLGRLDPGEQPWPVALPELCRQRGAAYAIHLESGALEALADRFAERLGPQHDLLDQMLLFAGILRELEIEGRLQAWPPRVVTWPVPSRTVTLRAFDTLCPDGKVLLFAAFEGGDVATCAALRRRGSGFDRIVGPARLRNEMGLTSGDWTRDYRYLARAVESSVGPLALGCFAEVHTWRRLVQDTAPGAWVAAVGSREVMMHPLAPAVAVPLGIDVGRAAVATLRGLAERFALPRLRPEELLTPVVDRVREAAADGQLEAVLGFDLLAMLREVLQGDRPER